jgi:hypothetical protein
MDQVNIKIEGHVYSVDKNLTVLEAGVSAAIRFRPFAITTMASAR